MFVSAHMMLPRGCGHVYAHVQDIDCKHTIRSRSEREKLYIFSSHLGLIRCLTPIRVSAIIYSQAYLDCSEDGHLCL